MQSVIREWDKARDRLVKKMWDSIFAKDIIEYNYAERDMALLNWKLM